MRIERVCLKGNGKMIFVYRVINKQGVFLGDYETPKDAVFSANVFRKFGLSGEAKSW
tara:strand:+ start:271 stop:441 length:171 start_codon:yes stop_codon:yes gene_type:complete